MAIGQPRRVLDCMPMLAPTWQATLCCPATRPGEGLRLAGVPHQQLILLALRAGSSGSIWLGWARQGGLLMQHRTPCEAAAA
jgi:hypothetical protein